MRLSSDLNKGWGGGGGGVGVGGHISVLYLCLRLSHRLFVLVLNVCHTGFLLTDCLGIIWTCVFVHNTKKNLTTVLLNSHCVDLLFIIIVYV